MFEIVITSHGELAMAMKHSLEMFFGELKDIQIVSLGSEGINAFSQKVDEIFQRMKSRDTLVFADIKGGTPFNEFAKKQAEWKGYFNLVGGVNLPVLIETVNYRMQGKSAAETVEMISDAGKITILSKLNLVSDIDDE